MGITSAIRDGKYVEVIKKGYYVDQDTGYFLPDTENWKLLRQAVEIRLKERKTNQEVAEFLNTSGFQCRKNNDEPYKKTKLNKKTVGALLSDPFTVACTSTETTTPICTKYTTLCHS